MNDIFSVALDARGVIVKISPSSDTIEKWLKKSGRDVDCHVYSFCSLSEYFEFCVDNDYEVSITK